MLGVDLFEFFVFREKLVFGDVLLGDSELFNQCLISSSHFLEVLQHLALFLQLGIEFGELLKGHNFGGLL